MLNSNTRNEDVPLLYQYINLTVAGRVRGSLSSLSLSRLPFFVSLVHSILLAFPPFFMTLVWSVLHLLCIISASGQRAREETLQQF